MDNINSVVEDEVNGLQGTKIQKKKFPERYPKQGSYIKLCNNRSWRFK